MYEKIFISKNTVMKKTTATTQIVINFLTLNCIFFVWIRFFIRNLILASVISTIISLAITTITTLIKNKQSKQSKLKQKEIEDAQNMFLSMSLSSCPEDFLFKLAKTRHKSVEKEHQYIVVNYALDHEKIVLYFEKNFDGITISDFMKIYEKVMKNSPSKIVVLCKSIKDQALFHFIKNFDQQIVLLDEFQTYQKLYKNYNCFPEINHSFKISTPAKIKDVWLSSFDRKNTKRYLLSAVALIVSSLFVRPTIFYCLISSILLFCAIICQTKPQETMPNCEII